MAFGPENEFSQELHATKYRDDNETFDDYCVRYARTAANSENHFRPLLDALRHQRVLPAGRQQLAVGRPHTITTMNCLSKETEILTEDGFLSLSELIKKSFINILSPVSGLLEEAVAKKFGVQKLNKISISKTFRNGGETFEVYATSNHRWILQDGSVTSSLKEGDMLKAADSNIQIDPKGFIHGLVFGDGTKSRDKERFILRLCGSKTKYLPFIKEHGDIISVTTPPSFGNQGDLRLRLKSDTELKKLPHKNSTIEYLRGFVEGWLAADGHIENGLCSIHSIDKEALEWLYDYIVLARYAPIGHVKSNTNPSNFGPRKNSLYYFIFRSTTIHFGYKVVLIEKAIREEEVYCVEESKYKQLILRNGLRTGNCFVGGHIDDSMAGIMDELKNGALTLRTGGGIGFDFSSIRPYGEPIRGLGFKAYATGPVTFMEMWNAMSGTVMSAGHRRGAMMGTLRCLSGDTKVHTLKGKIPIKDLVGQQPYVYVCDTGKKIPRIVKADKVFVSDRNRQMVRVWFDNDEYVDCTLDHQFLLSDTTYKEAEKLVCGDSVMAFKSSIKKWSKNWKRGIGCTGGKIRAEHRAVAEDILYAKISHEINVHHIDENTLNNTPSNLEILTRSEHAKKHNCNLLENQKRITTERKGKTLEEWLGKERGQAARENMSKAHKELHINKSVWNKNLTGEEYKSHYKKGFGNQHISNHKVVKTELIGIADKVYDISLPRYHNFAVNEVFVHNCDHPDILKFINAKKDQDSLKNFNLSVLITDDFMKALEADESYELKFDDKVYGELKASEVWAIIMQTNWQYAEPGVLFIDTIGYMDPLYYHAESWPVSTNPCGEVPLPHNGSCLLASLNIVKYLVPKLKTSNGNVFERTYEIDEHLLANDTVATVRALDTIIDKSYYPLAKYKERHQQDRRMGIGVTGVANALEIMGYSYGTPDYIEQQSKLLETIRNVAYTTSAILAKERGPFPLYDEKSYCAGGFFKTLPDNIQKLIHENGLRNALLLSIAPTGTISLCADNVSSGIEPPYSLTAKRLVHMNDGQREVEVNDYAYERYGVAGKTAYEVTAEEHVDVLCAAQKYIDHAVSKTCNVYGQIAGQGSGVTYDEFEQLYLRAYKNGAKGCCTFNVNGTKIGIFTTEQQQEENNGACRIDATTGIRTCDT